MFKFKPDIFDGTREIILNPSSVVVNTSKKGPENLISETREMRQLYSYIIKSLGFDSEISHSAQSAKKTSRRLKF